MVEVVAWVLGSSRSSPQIQWANWVVTGARAANKEGAPS